MTRSVLPRGGDVLAGVLAERARFVRFLERRLGTRDAAEELLQAALLNALRRGTGPRDMRQATPWFFRVLRNALTDRARREAAERRALERYAGKIAPSAVVAEPSPNSCRCVGREWESLKPAHRDILRRCDVEGQPLANVAAELGLRPGNARVRLHRARAALRARVERTCGACAGSGC